MYQLIARTQTRTILFHLKNIEQVMLWHQVITWTKLWSPGEVVFDDREIDMALWKLPKWMNVETKKKY